MKIPTKFKLLGQTITVEFQDDITYFEDVVAWAKYRQNKIILQPSTKQTPIVREKIEHNFLHELVHFILYYTSGDVEVEGPLHKDEHFVDRLAGFLHQALTTMEYENSENEIENET